MFPEGALGAEEDTSGKQITLTKLRAHRKKMAQRHRRIIFNNDGDDALHYGRFHTDPDVPATRDGFLALRMDHIGDTGLDSVFYCTTQSINAFTHHSEVTEVFAEDRRHGVPNKAAFEQPVARGGRIMAEQGRDFKAPSLRARRRRGNSRRAK